MRFQRLNFCEEFDLFFFLKTLTRQNYLAPVVWRERDVTWGKRYAFIVEVSVAFANWMLLTFISQVINATRYKVILKNWKASTRGWQRGTANWYRISITKKPIGKIGKQEQTSEFRMIWEHFRNFWTDSSCIAQRKHHRKALLGLRFNGHSSDFTQRA